MESCIKCQKEFEQKKKSQKFCCVKCRNIYNTEKHREVHNLHPGKVGRPEHKWIDLKDMTESDWIKFGEKINKY